MHGHKPPGSLLMTEQRFPVCGHLSRAVETKRFHSVLQSGHSCLGRTPTNQSLDVFITRRRYSGSRLGYGTGRRFNHQGVARKRMLLSVSYLEHGDC